MADPFDALIAGQGTGEVKSTRPGRDPFDLLIAAQEAPYSQMEAFRGGAVRDLPVAGPLLEEGYQRAAEKLGFPGSREFAARALAANPDYASLGGILSNTAVMGPIAGTTAGGVAFGARALPALGRLGENLAVRMGTGGATTGALGAADAYMRGESPVAGAVLGAAAGGATPAIGGVMRGLISPFNPIRRTIGEQAGQPAVDVLQGAGVRLPAGEITGSKTLQGFEDILRHYPGVGRTAEELLKRRDVDFATAALRRVDPSTPPGTIPTEDVLKGLSDKLGTAYDAIAKRTTLATNSTPFINDVANVRTNYIGQQLAPEARDPNLLAWMNRLDKLPAATGDQYQRMRTELRILADSKMTGPIGNKAETPESLAYRKLRSALDQQFARSATPEDAAAIRDLNMRYGNLKTVEDAMAGGGAESNKGFLSAARLEAAVRKRSANYPEGIGPDLLDLGKAGGAIMRPLPESGTGRQAIAATVLGGVGASAGGALGLRSEENQPSLGAGLGATAGLIGAPIAAFGLGRAALSPAGQRFLINQWLSTPRAVSLAAGPIQELTLPGRRPTLGNLGD